MISLPDINLGGILPALILCGAGLVILVLGWFLRKGVLTAATVIGLIGVVLAFMANSGLKTANQQAFSGLLAMDPLCWFLNMVILSATALTILISIRYLDDENVRMYEYFVLLLFSAVGLMFMVSGNHILMIFVGLETLSISIYVLTGALPWDPKRKEAALKYLILGGFSSGLFLYGAALLFGAAGSLGLPQLAKHFGQPGPISLMAKAGMGLLLVGFAFKVAAVPFHMWTPDVYEGAPTPLTAFMSVGVKAAAFAALLRVFFQSLDGMQVNWVQVLWVLSVLTMIIGNVIALVQENIKRMLAYSSIAHAGYILIGMVAATPEGTSGMLYYLLAYTFTNMGAFAVVALVGRKGEANVMIDDYRGLANAHPLIAVAMSIFLFSLAGIPPTAGFVGKFMLLKAAIFQGYYWLTIIAVLTSAISVYYYFRVIMRMYMEQPEKSPWPLSFDPATFLAVTVAAAVVIYIGVFPTNYLDMAMASVKPLF